MNTARAHAMVALISSALFVNLNIADALAASVYYVAPGGSDSAPGTQAQPWRTIGKAAQTLVAGDMVYIRAGTYAERVVPVNSGAAGSHITYAAFPGETVTIDGSGIGLSYWSGLFDVSDRNYLRVSGLRIVNSRAAGILADGSQHIVLDHNYTNNTVSSGIGVWNAYDVRIDNNEVILACNDGDQECITVAGTDVFEVKYNHVHHGGPGHNGGEGIDAKDGSSNGAVYGNHVHDMNRLGIYVDAWDKHTYNIAVYGNVTHDCEGNGFAVAAEAGGLLENVSIYNNIAYNNPGPGLTLAGWGEPVPSHPMRNIRIINNTFYHNGYASWGGGISIENPDLQGVVIRNNICSDNAQFQIQKEAGVPLNQLSIDHNLIDGYRGYEGELYGSGYVEGDPRFASAPGADFHLLRDSPAIDRGSAAGAPSNDYDGNARPVGSAVDIGAYEYGASTPVTPPTISSIVKMSGRRFRLQINGARFQPGIKVYIGSDTAPWSDTSYLSAVRLILGGGSALKRQFPLGVRVSIKVVNPDGGSASATYKRR